MQFIRNLLHIKFEFIRTRTDFLYFSILTKCQINGCSRIGRNCHLKDKNLGIYFNHKLFNNKFKIALL